MTDRGRWDLVLGIVAVVILAILPAFVGEYYIYLIRLVGIYVILSLGLNVFMGLAGQINIGSAAFFCIGAYTSTILQLKLGWHYLPSFPIAIALSFLVAWGMSYPLLRLRGHSMAIGTLALGTAVFLMAERFRGLTGGEDGVVVPAMKLFGQPMGGTFYYYVIVFFVVVTYAFCYFLTDSRIGLALKSLGEDEDAAAAMGIDVMHYKRVSWLISGVFGGLAGTLYAQQAEFLSPSTFALWTNLIALVILLVGGLGLNFGVVIGSTIMTLLPHLIAGFENFVLLINGLILFFVLRFLPDGVLGTAVKILEKRKRSKGLLGGIPAETF